MIDGMSQQPDISVVIPCRNEEANAAGIAAAVIAELERAAVSFELIFIDNGSTDRTVPIIQEICARDLRVRLIVNTRNFGQMRSPTHGIFAASGRAVIGMCADFQDPPALIGAFVARWRAGVPIVLGVRESEQTTRSLGFLREAFYRFMTSFNDHPVIPNATGFGLYDRKVVDAIAAMNEPEPFFRGMLVETGFPIEVIPYARPLRAGGKSNNNFFTLIDFALSGLASSSKKLVRLPMVVGLVIGILAGLCVLASLIAAVLDRSWAGWLVAAAVEAQLALLFLFIGLLGDRVRLISERTRRTPLVIEQERINFPADRAIR
jgi:glycosyltransferase involved in cell wall biosynthesis